ncbi:hypothetical protein X777_07004, partial [Ooceraea biroi]
TSFARNILNEPFPDRWIGRGGRISWPARSPDLTPLDFFLWGHLKNEVYRDIPNYNNDTTTTHIFNTKRSLNIFQEEYL